MTTVEVFAPAKINLALHVTGQRVDGFHLLDSLVAFAHSGDTLEITEADDLSLTVRGPFAAGVPADETNLIMKTARLFGGGRGARITLVKRLPVASGIGGGSADAAAAVRGLCKLWGIPWPSEAELIAIGADVPVCLKSGLTRMSGVGENIEHLGVTPNVGLLLVNPGIPVPTSLVFSGLKNKSNPAMEEPMPLPGSMLGAAESGSASFDRWIEWLTRQRNDLEVPAIEAFPVIGDVLKELRQMRGCRLARMSGSGATCFAIFDSEASVDVGDIKARHPDWWVEASANYPFTFDETSADGFSTGKV